MAFYEHIYLARQDVSAQQVEELTAKLTEILEENGGSVVTKEYWGLKNLSYRIRKNRKKGILGPENPGLSHSQEPQSAFLAAQY